MTMRSAIKLFLITAFGATGGAITTTSFAMQTAQSAPSAPQSTAPAPTGTGAQAQGNALRYYTPPTRSTDNQQTLLPFSYIILTRAEIAQRYLKAKAFVTCLARDTDADAFLQTSFGSAQERKLAHRMELRNVHCGGDASGISIPMLRAALSEVSINAVGDAVTRQTIISAADRKPMNVDKDVAPQLANALKVGGCHVASQPDAVRHVFATKPGSPDERAAENMVFAASPTCAGASLPKTVDPTIYRVVLALVFRQAIPTPNERG